MDGIEVVYIRSFEGRGSIGVVLEGVWNTLLCAMRVPGLRRRGVRSVQVCNPPDTLFVVLALCRTMGMKTIYDQHDVVPAMASMRPGLRHLRRLFEWFEAATVRCADTVVTSSQLQRDRLHERYGIDALLVRSATSPVNRSSSRHGPTCHLGYLGVLGAQEGLDDLLEALVIVAGRGTDIRLTVAGDGPHLESLRDRTRELGLDDIVQFPGWITGGELADFLGSIDAMVVADPESEYNHHCAMNKVLEAMAAAIPLVMRPLRENCIMTGDHPWIARDWSITGLADAIDDFAHATPAARLGEADRLACRYTDQLRWDDQAPAYVRAVAVETSP